MSVVVLCDIAANARYVTDAAAAPTLFLLHEVIQVIHKTWLWKPFAFSALEELPLRLHCN